MQNHNKKESEAWWRPAMVFYARTTAWIVIPALIAFFGKKYFTTTFSSNMVFLSLVMFAFLVTCYGIYREVKLYKKEINDNK